MFCRARLGVEVPARTLGLLNLYVQVHLGNNPSAKDIKKCCKAVENSMDKGFLSEVCVYTLPVGISVL